MEQDKLIYKKMAAVAADIGHIGKTQQNTMQRFNFRGIDDFLNALHPVLVKHGVVIAMDTISYNSELREVTRSNGKEGIDKHVSLIMKYTFLAEDGSSISATVPSEGVDSGDKATNKALSFAFKYALMQILSVPTEDVEEGDKVSPQLGVPSKKASFRKTEAKKVTEGF